MKTLFRFLSYLFPFLVLSTLFVRALEPSKIISIWPCDAPDEVKGEVGEEAVENTAEGG